MIWVFGIVFLTLIAVFAFRLYVKSNEIRQKLSALSRNRRIILGIVGSLLSFGSAFFAITVATTVKDWNQPSILSLLGTMVFMLGFVVLQVGAMLSFVSIVTDSETTDSSKRS
jgi:tellurite resistance protein TehA-like permease